MRDERTPDEKIAIAMLTKALTNSGFGIISDESITDSPDWGFELNSSRIGAECTCINLQTLMKWNNSTKSYIEGKCYEIIFPNEPNYWVRKSIEEKENKIPIYKQNSNSQDIWLLLHSDLDEPLPLYECDQNMIQLMIGSARSSNSDFSQIWFIHNEAGAQKLWEKGDPVESFPEVKIVDNNYPTCRVRQGFGKLTSTGGEFSVGKENIEETIMLQPLDTRYTL